MSTSAPPIVPARPSKSPSMEAQQASEAPKIPTRPTKKGIDKSGLSNSDRFAQSPLHGGVQPKGQSPISSSSSHDQSSTLNEPINRPASVSLPSLGEEGLEYGALDKPYEAQLSSSHQTRTVGDNLKLHAPKPSLPPDSAKQQIMAVTRTDSDKAASLGLGQSPQRRDRTPSRDSKIPRPSSTLSTHSDHGNHTDDEHGIPKIGQRVPMNSHLGDVQAPSPAPEEGKRHHSRKHSARNLPPGSYGLHGHGVDPQDKLERAYYEKHPELVGKHKKHQIHDHRQSDYAMSSNDLNRMVRDTARRRPTSGLYNEAASTPTEDVGYYASDQYAHRASTPQDSSQAEKGSSYFPEDGPLPKAADEKSSVPHAIHVDDSKHPEHYSYGTENPEAEDYHAPILADDAVDADLDVTAQHPAIRPGFDRSRSYDADEPNRPSIRHPTIALDEQPERGFNSTPLDDVEEYEPLFDGEKKEEERKQIASEKKASRHFPSKDIWEDAPNSAHHSTEVSTPDVEEQNQRRSKASFSENRSITPAQAFAQYQEELAEKEANGRSNNFLPLSADAKPKWIDHQSHLAVSKPSGARRFPSKDVWEDAPESHIQETTLSESAIEDEGESEDTKPKIPVRPAKKAAEESRAPPAIPSRPKPTQAPGDDTAKQPPPVSEKPKPQIPSRPVKKLSGDSKDGETVKPPKPPVPSRPVGGKIAALQAGFMSDLNKRLQLGPQAMKKDEPAQEEEVVEKEKAPLSDARKGRARGPQRRAPAKAASPAKEPPASVLSVFQPQTIWSIDSGERLVVTEESRKAREEPSKTGTEPAENLVKTISHESSKEAGSPLTKAVSKESEPLVLNEPSQDATSTAPAPAGDVDVTAQTNPAEPTPAAQDSLPADLEQPATKPAIQAVDEVNQDIASAKPSSPEAEEKSVPETRYHGAAHESPATEQDIGEVPLAQPEKKMASY